MIICSSVSYRWRFWWFDASCLSLDAAVTLACEGEEEADCRLGGCLFTVSEGSVLVPATCDCLTLDYCWTTAAYCKASSFYIRIGVLPWHVGVRVIRTLP